MKVNLPFNFSWSAFAKASIVAAATSYSGCATTHVTRNIHDFCSVEPVEITRNHVNVFFTPFYYRDGNMRDSFMQQISSDPAFRYATAIAVASEEDGFNQDCSQPPFTGAMRCLQVTNRNELTRIVLSGGFFALVIPGGTPFLDPEVCQRGVNVRTIVMHERE